jgi:hypothetical protein
MIKIAVYIITIAFIYLFAVTFAPLSGVGAEHSKTIVGFLLGTGFTTFLNYYWGGSPGKKDDEDKQ